MRSFLFSVLTVLLLGACASTRPPYQAPVGTDFELSIKRDFDALPNYTRLYFQHGNRVTEKALDRWTTYCWLHVYDPNMKADYTTSVKQGVFGITRVDSRYQSSRRASGVSAYYASMGVGLASYRQAMGLDWRRDGPPSYYLYRIEMKLASAAQPDVQKLICEKKWSTRGYHYPSMGEIEAALGDVMSIARAA